MIYMEIKTGYIQIKIKKGLCSDKLKLGEANNGQQQKSI